MKRVKITGEVTIQVIQYLDVSSDEIRELLDDEENLKCNVDEDGCTKQIIEWHYIRGEVIA